MGEKGYIHFLTKIIERKVDESVRWRFYRYGKGEFSGPILQVMVRGKKITLRASFMYEDLLQWIYLNLTGGKIHKVTGNIESYFSLKNLLGDSPLSNRIRNAGSKQKISLNEEFELEEMKKLFITIAPYSYMFISISPVTFTSIEKIKSKKKFPKPEDLVEPKTNFATLTFPFNHKNYLYITKTVLPDFKVREANKIALENIYCIRKLIPPEKGEATRKTVTRDLILRRRVSYNNSFHEKIYQILI